MNAAERVTAANDISDAITLRLRFLESIAFEFSALHGTKQPVDHGQAAIWCRIGEDAADAIRAIENIIEVLRGDADGT